TGKDAGEPHAGCVRSWRLSSLSLVRSHQLTLPDDVTLHGLFEISLRRACVQRNFCIKRIDLEEVTMRSRWRTGSSVASLSKVILSLKSARLKTFSRR